MRMRAVRYTLMSVFEQLTGYSPKAVQHKIARGIWTEGKEYRRAPDGHILIDLEGFEKWVESPPLATTGRD